MTTYTLSDLLSPETAEDALDALLTDLAAQGFPTTAWDDFSVIVGLVRSDARALADLLQLVAAVARAGLVDLSPGTDPGSPGDWLSLLASNYGLSRNPATFAVIRATVAVAATASPLNIAAGGLTLQATIGSSRYRYTSTNTGAVLIPNGTSAPVEFRAELAGVAHNRVLADVVAPVQSLPGVTTTLLNVGDGSPMVTRANNPEADSSLRARMRGRWDTIGLNHTVAALDFLARNAPDVVTPVTRTFVDGSNPLGPGSVEIWLAGEAGPTSSADVTAVQAYLAPRASMGSVITCQPAVSRVVTIQATLHVLAAYPLAADLVRADLDALIRAAPIGGKLYASEILDALHGREHGVRSVPLGLVFVNGAALADLALLPSEVAVPGAHALTVVNV